MKPTFRSIIALVIFLGFATIISASNFAHGIKKVDTKQHSNLVKEDGAQILHGQILLNF